MDRRGGAPSPRAWRGVDQPPPPNLPPARGRSNLSELIPSPVRGRVREGVFVTLKWRALVYGSDLWVMFSSPSGRGEETFGWGGRIGGTVLLCGGVFFSAFWVCLGAECPWFWVIEPPAVVARFIPFIVATRYCGDSYLYYRFF